MHPLYDTAQLIMLDIHGVGLRESPGLQGLGILKHIKETNPAQAVILYSSQSQRLSTRDVSMLADAVLDKEVDYIEYKKYVDNLLTRRASPGYFISAMNRELGDDAMLVPKAVSRAGSAMRRGSTGSFERYVAKNLQNEKQIDRIIKIVGFGVAAVRLMSS